MRNSLRLITNATMYFNVFWIVLCLFLFSVLELSIAEIRGLVDWRLYPTLTYLMELFFANWFFIIGLVNLLTWILTSVHLVMNDDISWGERTPWFVSFCVLLFIANAVYWYLHIFSKGVISSSGNRQDPLPLN